MASTRCADCGCEVILIQADSPPPLCVVCQVIRQAPAADRPRLRQVLSRE